MPSLLDKINTIVVVMMENRSFDHLLGYLALPPHSRQNVDGVRQTQAWKNAASSLYDGDSYAPFPLTDPYNLIDADPPHEWYNIARQMGDPVNGVYPMNGFVTNYAGAKGAPAIRAGDNPPVMGYFEAEHVPVADFLAQNFAICDHWFSSIPAGTQPNRLMAFSGYTKIAVNTFPLPQQYLVYDWLSAHQVRWRVYHEGIPFFAMMLEWLSDIMHGDHFRPLTTLWDDVQNEPPDEFPQVIFVEPSYTDAPHNGTSRDDHAPSAVKGGQEFLLEVYRGISLNPDVWNGAVMIVTYDEHGGFFDHVSPPPIPTNPAPGAIYTRSFTTLGVRVPGFVVSPFVEPKAVFNGVLDHVSILKLIGQKFGRGAGYSPVVDQRSVGNVLEVLTRRSPRRQIPSAPALQQYLAKEPEPAGYQPGTLPPSIIGEGFKRSLDEIRKYPSPQKFGDLLADFPPDPNIRGS